MRLHFFGAVDGFDVAVSSEENERQLVGFVEPFRNIEAIFPAGKLYVQQQQVRLVGFEHFQGLGVVDRRTAMRIAQLFERAQYRARYHQFIFNNTYF
ncbi:hypothetical protein D3C87_1793910 [compost metagenome]